MAVTDDVAPNGRGVAKTNTFADELDALAEKAGMHTDLHHAMHALAKKMREPQHPQPEPAPSEDERERLIGIIRDKQGRGYYTPPVTADAILADGFHRTKPEKPQPDHAALIALLRDPSTLAADVYQRRNLFNEAADALEGKPHAS